MLITPPLFTPRGYCSIFTFFCFINHKHSHFSAAAFRCHYVQFPVVAGLYRRCHPPPPMRKASTCICLFSLSYITITPVLPIPSWRRKLETEFLKYLAVRVLATPPTAQLITFLTMSFSYYHIGDITCVSPCCNTWRHIVVVIHFSELEITYTPFTFAVKFQWRFFSECNFHVLIHRQGV